VRVRVPSRAATRMVSSLASTHLWPPHISGLHTSLAFLLTSLQFLHHVVWKRWEPTFAETVRDWTHHSTVHRAPEVGDLREETAQGSSHLQDSITAVMGSMEQHR
jgi:hypothetical protein